MLGWCLFVGVSPPNTRSFPCLVELGLWWVLATPQPPGWLAARVVAFGWMTCPMDVCPHSLYHFEDDWCGQMLGSMYPLLGQIGISLPVWPAPSGALLARHYVLQGPSTSGPLGLYFRPQPIKPKHGLFGVWLEGLVVQGPCQIFSQSCH